MSKNEEIQAYHAFIQSLPEASYIRPWLVEIAMEVETIIRNDHPIMLSPRKAGQLAEQCIKNAQSEASSIVKRAEDDAASLRFAAHQFGIKVRADAKDALRRIADNI